MPVPARFPLVQALLQAQAQVSAAVLLVALLLPLVLIPREEPSWECRLSTSSCRPLACSAGPAGPDLEAPAMVWALGQDWGQQG